MKKQILVLLLVLGMIGSNLGFVTGKEVSTKNKLETETITETNNERFKINFNTDWRYKKGDISGASQTEFNDEKWGYVNLPHTTTFYTADNKDAYLGISWYRKDFSLDENLQGKKLMLNFEAAMQCAEVYINGKHILRHEGGYSPFVIDITDEVNYGENNVIAVKIDSRPNASFAPGKTNPDFQYFGGIYGNSYITVTDEIHITDAVEAKQTAGGGVFVTAPEVSKDSALVKVKTHVENETGESKEVTLITELLDQNENIIVSKEDTITIDSKNTNNFEQSLTVENPRLWSPNTPELYTVRSTVKSGADVKDVVDTTYGIRKVEWKREGLYINDELMDVEGANLHSEIYMLGNAIPDNAIYEEVKRFKEDGFDIMRMSHYPHRQAYYDACDKYGVMVLECASGWQNFSNTPEFKNSTYNELRTDICHKRNHPSIVAWETSLNESRYNNEWAKEMNRIAKEEYPKDGLTYAYTAGCYEWDVWDIGLSTPQAGIFGTGNEGAENIKYKDKPMIIAEYGDWTYGGSGSSTRVTRENKNSYGKKGGDEGMLIQADNIQESVQTNRQRGKNWLGASMFWDYADYAGFDVGMLTYCGVVDLYRIQKHAAYFYQSQRPADIDLSSYGLESGPMVYIANLWDNKADTEVRIYSNCDTVELFLNGKSLGERGHDETIWGPHGNVDPSGYPNSNSGKEISADHLKNSPITFNLDKYEAGQLKAVGKINGEVVTEYIRNTPKAPTNINLRMESDVAVPLDGSSAKLVWVDITDVDGTVVGNAYTDVELEVEGPGLIVGPKTITTRGGQLAVWVRSKRGEGDIKLKATGENLKSTSITIPTSNVAGLPNVPEGGDADEYEMAQNVEETNIFLNKSSRASTENIQSSKKELKEYANDGNDNSKWCASNGAYPQWWEVDLGATYTLETMNLSFETPGSAYHYTVAISEDPMTDDNYNDHIIIDNSNGSTDSALALENVKGRYVRITFTKATNNEWAVLREVSGTGSTFNLALNKPVSASSVNTGKNGVEKAEYAVDGNASTYWCGIGGEGSKGHWFQVDLKDTYKLSSVNVLFEKNDAAYKFVLQGSVDGKHYKDIKDFRNGDGCGELVSVDTEEVVQYLRIYDISTKYPGSQWPAIREIEAYGDKVNYKLSSVTREKDAYASSSKEGSQPSHGSNGVPGWYWYPATMDNEWWYIDTKGIYDIDNIQMTWNLEELHKYIIDLSTDGKTWITVVDRSENGNNEIRPYEMINGTARYIRVRLPEGRTSNQGFGLFDAYAPEPEARKVDNIAKPEGIVTFEGTEFENLELPKEIDVVLEDGIKTTLPVTWSKEDYEKAHEGKNIISGTLSEITGVKLGTDKLVTIEIMIQKNIEIPQIIKQPNDLSLQEGDKAVFSVEAKVEDGGSLSYQWQQSRNQGKDWEIIGDANKSSYEINNVSLQHNGLQFKCVITNTRDGQEAKSIESSVVKLNVTENQTERNKVALSIAIEAAKNASLENVVPAVVKEFETALANAVTVFDKTDATQVEVDEAFDRLAKALHMLEFFKGDKTALKGFIDKINGLNSIKYTEASWKVLQDVLKVTNDVLTDENAMQKEVNETYTNLVNAFLKLRLIPNKDALAELIKTAEGLQAANYSAEGWDLVQKTLADARAVLVNPDATQSEVDEANEALTKAVAGTINVPSANETIESSTNNGKEAAKTGDTVNMMYPLASLAIALLVLLTNKKGKIRDNR